MAGPSAFRSAPFDGFRCATYSSRKSYQCTNVAGSRESTCVPLVKLNQVFEVPVKCLTRLAQWPPVCSSCHWHAMNVGTLILSTNLLGFSGSATAGM